MGNSNEKKQHGGLRPGAGRKKKDITKRYGFNAPEDVAQILENIQGSKSDYIIEAIRAYNMKQR